MPSREIQYQTEGDVLSRQYHGYAAYPTGGGPGVIVLHAWWGLTPFFKRVCDRLAEAGFTAFAPDLYGGKTAHNIEQAEKLRDASDSAYTRAAVLGAVNEIKHLPGVDPKCLGVIGFSLGAAWTLVLSSQVPDEIQAAVLFYGTEKVDFSKIQASIMGHFSPQDEWEPLDGIRMMEADLKDAGRDYTFHYYPGAGHWFMEDDHEEAYHANSADLAWQRTIDFLNEKLKPKKEQG